MTLADYRTELRINIDDNNSYVRTRFSDTQLNSFINNARRMVNKETFVNTNFFLLFPDVNTDEYDLPSDYITYDYLLNVLDEEYFRPTVKPVALISKSQLYTMADEVNPFYIDEPRRKIIFHDLPDTDIVDQDYLVLAYSRSGKTLTVCADSTYSTTIDTTGITGGALTVDIKLTSVTYLEVGDYIRVLGDSAAGEQHSKAEICYVSAIDTVTKIATISKTVTYAGVESTSFQNNHSAGNTVYILDSNDITKWNDVKAFSRVNDIVNSVTEYLKVVKVTDNSNGTYTLTAGTWDITEQAYKMATASLTSATAGDLSDYGNVLKVYTTDWTTTVNYASRVTGSGPYVVNNCKLRFSNCVMCYIANTKNMIYATETDRFPLDVQEIIPLKAEVQAYMREGLTDMANRSEALYREKLNDIVHKLISEKQLHVGRI